MIITKNGIAIRMAVSDMRVMGRATQGVRLVNLNENDEIASVAKIAVDEDDEMLEEENNLESNETTDTEETNEEENNLESDETTDTEETNTED